MGAFFIRVEHTDLYKRLDRASTFKDLKPEAQNRKGTEGQLGGTTCPRFSMRMR